MIGSALRCREKSRPKGSSRLGRMPRRVASAIVLCLALAATLSFAACGGEDAQLLSGETAREIDANLDAVQQLADEGDCVGAESAVEQVGEQIDGLEEVDPKLKRALEAGAERLEEVIATCEESTTEAVGPARIPDEEEDEEAEEKERDESRRQQGRGGGNQGNEGSGREESAPETGGPSQPQNEAEGGGNEGENTPPSGGEGGEEEQSGGVSPGSAVEEGE